MARTRKGGRLAALPLLAIAAVILTVLGVQTGGVAYKEAVATLDPCPSQSASPSPTTTDVPVPGTASPSPTPSQASCNPANLRTELWPSVATIGATFKVSGSLTCHDAPVGGTRIVIRETTHGVTVTYAVNTGDDGAYSWSDKPDAKATYLVAWAGRDGCPDGAVRPAMTAQVRPGVILNVSKTALQPLETAHFGGSVVPSHPGAHVALQMLQGSTGQWKTVVNGKLDGNSHYALSYWTEYQGVGSFRVALPTPDADHTWNVSRVVRVQWKTT